MFGFLVEGMVVVYFGFQVDYCVGLVEVFE